ncbi:hypothetical protein EVAR_46721_1 [Eumeta japonica]|uniref:Uncharacterized protein n=1 Tax=Eumeta variegata TaxID=151549 RepID=A0A4C1XBD1_EUMVA|nr:hypothetical protein EVAR_46721_1 [Eumeta japonica]
MDAACSICCRTNESTHKLRIRRTNETAAAFILSPKFIRERRVRIAPPPSRIGRFTANGVTRQSLRCIGESFPKAYSPPRGDSGDSDRHSEKISNVYLLRSKRHSLYDKWTDRLMSLNNRIPMATFEYGTLKTIS